MLLAALVGGSVTVALGLVVDGNLIVVMVPFLALDVRSVKGDAEARESAPEVRIGPL